MTLSLALAPLLPEPLIAGLVGAAALTALIASRRGRVLRLAAIAAVAAALLNPALVREERQSLPDVLALVVDESESMRIGGRADAAARLAAELRAKAEADPTLELVEARAAPGDDGTRLFEAVAAALADAPRGRLAGVIALTDGQAHDAAGDPKAFQPGAPVHAVILGDREKGDRRLVVRRAPPFGIIGERSTFTVRVEDPSAPPGARIEVTLSLDGGEPLTASAPVGRDVDVEIELKRRGANVVEIAAAPGPDELTLANNRAAVSVAGVRDRLRVLLITGEPHAGARMWRDLLKADPSVDLVHFTILRPPTKPDNTPENELSLIRFPTEELFEDKISQFDLVIFDRYRRRDVLRMIYLDNVARYVEKGGALLIAAGPPFAGPFSLHRTPLASVLPARPTGDILDVGYTPAVSAAGRAHPITSGLAPDPSKPGWGRWFRLIDVVQVAGEKLMEGPDGRPLLLVDRVSEGRVALVLSDQTWLWARGVEGGGPYGELFRRLAHWLMKEPDLEEERLSAAVSEGVMKVERRTLGEAPPPAEATAPSGAVTPVPLAQTAPGVFAGQAPVGETGLWRVKSGELTAAVSAGPLNPRELADLRPTDAVLGPFVAATGGGTMFAGDGAGARLPELRRTRPGDLQAGRGWLGLQENKAYVGLSQDRRPLAPALLAVALALGLLAGAWAREGR